MLVYMLQVSEFCKMAEFCKVPWFQGTYIYGRPSRRLALREEVLGGQCYGGPMLWGALWLLKDPMLRRGSGCAAVTPGVALAPSIRGSQWPPLSPLLRHPIFLAASAPAPPAGVCAHRCWVFGGSGFSFSLSSVKSYRLLLLRPGNKILS